MASEKERSYYACVFSVMHLLRGPEKRTLFDEEKAPKWCYLWTWTFADPFPRHDVVEALKRWEGLRKSLQRDGRKFVRSIEQGDKSGHWHFHAVTPDRWSAKDMWARSFRFGFGRPDVKPVPIDKGLYVAKYIRKRLNLPPGRRRWACVGFDGVPASRLKCATKVLQVVAIEPRSYWYHGKEWSLPDNRTLIVRTEGEPPPTEPRFIKMEIKPNAGKHVLEQLAKGKFVAVGEYRGTSTREQRVTDYKTNQSVSKVIVEHTIEFGTKAITASEWLPPGATAESVKAPANKGDAVMVEYTGISKKYGMDVVSIKPLGGLV